jgi:hypothetical protein
MSKQRRKRHTPEQIVAKLRDAPSCSSLLGSREAAKPRRHGEPNCFAIPDWGSS